MNQYFLQWNPRARHCGGLATISIVALFFCFCQDALAQSAVPPLKANAPISVQATHLLGFEDAKNNCGGTLSIQDDVLQFQHPGKPGARVKIASLRDVFLGAESKQVGGLPMKLGKAAAPYGAGRVVSLFAHKKYDTLTLEYADKDGGIHGAVFQLNEGKGELVRDELVARGVSATSLEEQLTKQNTAEVTHETK
ncbi:MAG: hypothetical protein LAO56_12895 [Acidobacteriia bacterium]|nr:hypothetical protein [Terriglobia bacterium]